MTRPKEDVRELTDEAFEAFWNVITRHYPEAEAGDLSPLRTIRLQMAAEEAVQEWIENNASRR